MKNHSLDANVSERLPHEMAKYSSGTAQYSSGSVHDKVYGKDAISGRCVDVVKKGLYRFRYCSRVRCADARVINARGGSCAKRLINLAGIVEFKAIIRESADHILAIPVDQFIPEVIHVKARNNLPLSGAFSRIAGISRKFLGV